MLVTASSPLARSALHTITHGRATSLLLLKQTAGLSLHHQPLQQARNFSFSFKSRTHSNQNLEHVERPEAKFAKSESWSHPVYSQAQMQAIEIAHRETKSWSDWVAISAVRIMRSGFDIATGYKHDTQIALGNKDPGSGQLSAGRSDMTSAKWMTRFIFLESIAGVPGFVAGTLRHLKSLRTLRRDNGWIETLLEEGYNERMHLLSFLKLHDPGIFMRTMIIFAQGIFYNGFFISYLISPRTCHRFVGYLEEEAVITYTRAIADIEAGKLPEWNELKAPDLAIGYWNMGEHATMKDLLYYIRADEAKHREVNHTLANLDPSVDQNPFLSEYEDPTKPHPSKTIEYIKSTGWEREEVKPRL